MLHRANSCSSSALSLSAVTWLPDNCWYRVKYYFSDRVYLDKTLLILYLCASNPNLNFPPTNVTRSTLNNQKTFKMSKIKSLIEKVSRLIVLMLPWGLHCLHRSTHNRRIQYQRGLKTRCLFLFSLLFWPCQTNSSSRCLLPKEWR